MMLPSHFSLPGHISMASCGLKHKVSCPPQGLTKLASISAVCFSHIPGPFCLGPLECVMRVKKKKEEAGNKT
jgi:hypothetical protein